MAFAAPALTMAGKTLLHKGLAGETIKFTRMKMGDGSLTTQNPAELTDLIHTITEVDIETLNRQNNYVSMRGVFSNQSLEAGFYWREFGLFAQDPDKGEILYCYSNAGDLAEYITSADASEIVKKLTMSVAISDVQNIILVADDSVVFATLDDLAKINDVIPLTHQKQSNIHLFTGLTRTGLVPVQFTAAADYNAGETLTIDSIRYTVALSSGDEPSGVVWKSGTRQLGLCDSESMTLIIISSKDNVPAHNVDPEAHPDIRALLAGMSADMSQLKNALLTDVTGNPWSVYFTSAGIGEVVVTGTWNEAQARIEF